MVQKKAPTWYVPAETTNVAAPTLRTLDFFKIFIRHVPTGNEVSFDGWVTSFSDNYTSQWNEEMVYGRMDPLSTFQGTRRAISIAFDVVSDSKTACLANMMMVRELTQFLYPMYTGGGPHSGQNQQNVLKAGPLLAMRWTNLISSPNNEGQRLIGYINGGLNYAPDMNEGGFLAGEIEPGASYEAGAGTGIRNYYPKKFSLSLTFTVIHTHLMGWSAVEGASTTFVFGGQERIGQAFPNAQLAPPPPPPAAATATPPPPVEGEVSQTADGASENLDTGPGPDEAATSATMNGEPTQEERRASEQRSAELRAAAEAEMLDAMGGQERADHVTGDMEGTGEGENIDWGNSGPGSGAPPGAEYEQENK